MSIHESIKKSSSTEDFNHKIPDWLTLDHFPDDTRVNLTPRGRRFVFQKSLILKNLEHIVSRAQWSRYRSNPEMSIPVSTLRLLVEDERELFMTSFTVTSIGNKKIQLPLKLPIRTRNNSLAKLLALLTLSKNVFQTGTYQTDQREKIEHLIETFDSIFDVNLSPDEEITYNQRGYYLKIPAQICSAIIKVFTGEYSASFPQIISSVAKLEDEQGILDFVTMWLKYSRLYRFDNSQENLFMFRYNDETRELVKLIEMLGVKYETGSIIDGGNFVPVYRIPNVADNEIILGTPSLLSRLKSKIRNQTARINELEAIKDDLESKLRGTTRGIGEKVTWSRAMDERLAEDLTEKLVEFERILIQTRNENEKLKRLLKDSGAILEVEESIFVENSDGEKIVEDINQLREEVNQLKERLAILNQPSQGKELSYKVTKEITMKADHAPIGIDVDLRPLVKTFLAHPDNWVLFILGTNQSLTKEQIGRILGFSADRRLELQGCLNEFVNRHILKVTTSSHGEEIYSLDRWQWSDLIGSYTTTLLSDKENVPLEVRQLVRSVLK